MFNAAEIHLVLNHFPVILPLTGIGVLLAGLALRLAEVMRVAFCLLVAGALFAIPTYLTGGPAAAVVKNYPEISRLLIHDHRESGTISFALLGAMGLYSGVLLFISFRRSVPRAALGLLLLFAIACSVSVARTAHLGGEIRHEEVRLSDRF